MKNIIIAVLILCCSVLSVSSQVLPGGIRDNFEKKKTQRKKGAAPKFYTGIGLRGINALDDWGIEFSIKAGYIPHKNFAIGASYNSILSKNLDIIPLNGAILRMQSFALQPEFLLWIDKYFLFSIYGNAGVAFVATNSSGNVDLVDNLNGDWIFQSEQGVKFCYRMLEELWLCFEGAYRSSFGLNYTAFSESDISGGVFGVTFKAFVF